MKKIFKLFFAVVLAVCACAFSVGCDKSGNTDENIFQNSFESVITVDKKAKT